MGVGEETAVSEGRVVVRGAKDIVEGVLGLYGRLRQLHNLHLTGVQGEL